MSWDEKAIKTHWPGNQPSSRRLLFILRNQPSILISVNFLLTREEICGGARNCECCAHITLADSKYSCKTWRRHQMETFSTLLALCAGNSPVPVNSPHKGQWRGALMFSLICARINDWVNNREADDLRHHRGHYDVNVMNILILKHINRILLCGMITDLDPCDLL